MAENLPDTNVGNIEYIRREDAVDVIAKRSGFETAERAKKWAMMHPIDLDPWFGAVATAITAVESLEPNDVVPVVRCKDCKFYTSMRPDIKTGICDLNMHHMGDDGFCSCGERREE